MSPMLSNSVVSYVCRISSILSYLSLSTILGPKGRHTITGWTPNLIMTREYVKRYPSHGESCVEESGVRETN
jgi:hypothetical protein